MATLIINNAKLEIVPGAFVYIENPKTNTYAFIEWDTLTPPEQETYLTKEAEIMELEKSCLFMTPSVVENLQNGSAKAQLQRLRIYRELYLSPV